MTIIKSAKEFKQFLYFEEAIDSSTGETINVNEYEYPILVEWISDKMLKVRTKEDIKTLLKFMTISL